MKTYRILVSVLLPITLFVSQSFAESNKKIDRAAATALCEIEGVQEKQKSVKPFSGIRKTIYDLEQEACIRTAMGDVEWTAQLFGSELYQFAPGQDILVGPEAVMQELTNPSFNHPIQTLWQPIDVMVGPSKDMAWVYGYVNTTQHDGSSSRGKYVSIWKKLDGKWLAVADIRNAR